MEGEVFPPFSAAGNEREIKIAVLCREVPDTRTEEALAIVCKRQTAFNSLYSDPGTKNSQCGREALDIGNISSRRDVQVGRHVV